MRLQVLHSEIQGKEQKIVALQKSYLSYLANMDKKYGIIIIAKNIQAAEYWYISVCGKHGNRRHKTRVLLTLNQISSLYAD